MALPKIYLWDGIVISIMRRFNTDMQGEVGYSLKKSSFFGWAVFFGIFMGVSSVQSAIYHVAMEGEDFLSCQKGTNPHTPRRSIEGSLRCLSAGDTLYVHSGTYAEGILSWETPFDNGESWDRPITVATYPGDTVIITPPAGTAFFWIKENSDKYLIIDGFIVDCRHIAWHGFKLHGGVSRVRIINTEVRNAKFSGVLVTVSSARGAKSPGYHEFINMKVHHSGESTQDHGFYIETGHNLIEHSEIYSNSGWGIHNFRSSNNFAHHNTYRHNLVYRNGLKGWACGIMLSSGYENVAYNNNVYENPTGLCTLYRSTNNRFYNNLVYQNFTNGIFVGGGKENIDTGIYHNTVYGNKVYGIFIEKGVSNVFVKNNIIFQNARRNLVLGEEGQNEARVSHNLQEDPSFINSTEKDFHLNPSSRAIDKGVAVSGMTFDCDGIERPQGKLPDIGAYEFQNPKPAQDAHSEKLQKS